MKRLLCVLFFIGCCSVAQAQDVINVPQRGYQMESQTIPGYEIPARVIPPRQVQIARPLPPVQYQRAGFAIVPPRVARFGPFWFSQDAGRCPRCGGYHPLPTRAPVYLAPQGHR